MQQLATALLESGVRIMFFDKRGLVEAEGFRDGSQSVSREAALAKLSAQFAQKQQLLGCEGVDQIKSLEAQTDTLRQQREIAQHLWQELHAATGSLPPQIGLPLVGVILSGLAVGGETVLLAPVMDGFGIPDPFWQGFTALTLVSISSGLLELSSHQIRHLLTVPQSLQNDGRHGEPQRLRYALLKASITALLTCFALMLLVVLGRWRAEEMIFAATLQFGSLGNFLSAHPQLTTLCVTLLTIGLPVFAATAFGWSFDKLRLAWDWRKARRTFIKHSRKLAAASRKHEALLQKRTYQIAALKEDEKDSINRYLQSHELGRLIGAQQQPLWQVIVKILSVVPAIFVSCLLLDPAVSVVLTTGIVRGMIYAFATLGLGGLFAYHALKAWDRPTAAQLYAQKATVWKESAASRQGSPPRNARRDDNTLEAEAGNAGIENRHYSY